MRCVTLGVALGSLLGLASCNPFSSGAFSCTENSQCDLSGGVCESNGFCSFADGSCESGKRYGDGSGDLSGVCVGEEPDPDAGNSGDGPDGCEWPRSPTHFDECAIGSAQPAPVFGGGDNVLDTDSGQLTIGGTTTNLTASVIAQAGGPEVALYFFEAFDLPDGNRLRIVGSRAALIASDSTITVGGEIDVGATRGQAAAPAASGFVDHCTGARDADGIGGGAGGGGFGSAGGAGGFGENVAGGGGDPGGAVDPGDVILPGCPGGIGQNAAGTQMGTGGLGGGAAQLSARTSITLAGTAVLTAGGGGGNAVGVNGSGGGGGGAGGFIGFDSSAVTLGGALVLIQGGGGAEGSGTSTLGDSGDDAPKTNNLAPGGAGLSGSGGDGGDGGFNGGDGAAGNDSTTNGGGGGGGGLGVTICRGCP